MDATREKCHERHNKMKPTCKMEQDKYDLTRQKWSKRHNKEQEDKCNVLRRKR